MLSQLKRTEQYIGKRIIRKEDLKLLQGGGTFIDDITPNNCLYAGLVRCPYPHAKIIDVRVKSNDTSSFKLFRYEDVKDQYLEPPSCQYGDWVKSVPLRCLAMNKARYVGEAVAAVLTEKRNSVEDALESVLAEYEQLNPITDVESAQALGAGIINGECQDNVPARLIYRNGDAEESLQSASRIFERTFRVQRHAPSPIEARGCVSYYDQASNELKVWSSTHTPHLLRSVLASALSMNENKVHVVSPNIGGSFGVKGNTYPEDILIPLLSVITKRPVKWIENRTEDLTSANHAREQINKVKFAVNNEGKITAIISELTVDLGAYPTSSGPLEGLNAICYLTGCYEIMNYSVELKGVVTNKTPIGAYRAFGTSSSNFVLERMIDIISREMNMDPFDMRLRNFAKLFPFTNAAGAIYDSGNFSKGLAIAREKIKDEIDFLVKNQESSKQANYIGIGYACSVDPTGIAIKDSPISAFDAVTVRISRNGRVSVFTGGCGMIGTGHETAFAQVVGDSLGVDMNDIDVYEGDTLYNPVGQGSFSDRSLIYAGSAAVLAAKEVKKTVLELASYLLESDVGDLNINGGTIYVEEEPEREVKLSDIARLFYFSSYRIPTYIQGKLESTQYYNMRGFSFIPPNEPTIYYPCHGNSTQVAVISVDIETGKIRVIAHLVAHDSGRVINPLLVEGQIQGGVAAGLGGTLFEEAGYDSNGQPLATSFVDYLIPTALDVPNVIVSGFESPSPITILGSKGAGESGAIGAYAAIANALENALAPLNIQISELPLKPEYVWKKIVESMRRS